jgi:hypothetical protein
VEVAGRSCAVLDVVMRKDWPGTLSGRVTRADGNPGPAGIKVDLIRVEGERQEQKTELLIGATVQTNDNGEYSFLGVSPGMYKVVLKIYEPPTSELPYKTLYWPAANTEAGASLVEVGPNGTSLQCDFTLLRPLKSALVKLVVLLPDGTPAEGAHGFILAEMDGMHQRAGDATTDAFGQLSFAAIEGFYYTVFISTPESISAPGVRFSAADGLQSITIRLIPRNE